MEFMSLRCSNNDVDRNPLVWSMVVSSWLFESATCGSDTFVAAGSAMRLPDDDKQIANNCEVTVAEKEL